MAKKKDRGGSKSNDRGEPKMEAAGGAVELTAEPEAPAADPQLPPSPSIESAPASAPIESAAIESAPVESAPVEKKPAAPIPAELATLVERLRLGRCVLC